MLPVVKIGGVIDHLREGGSAKRSGWNGKDQFISLQAPDSNSKMTLPYIYITTQDGALIPWLASQSDILADDWELINKGE